MEFRILGPMEVRDGARSIEVPGGRARALLAMLVLHAGDVVPAERLIDELWGELPPPTAGTIVQMHVLKLRKILEPGREAIGHPALLVTQGSGYRLAIDPGSVDAVRFKQILDQAYGRQSEQRAERLAEALALWRGPALADFIYQPFAQSTIASLEELRLAALEARIEADLDVGREQGLAAELDELVREHPFRERLRALQMRALYRMGRQADALAAYRAARELLVEELGVEPGPELRQLEASILRHDPSLREWTTGRERTTAGGWLGHERRRVTVVGIELVPTTDENLDPEVLAAASSRAGAAAAGVLHAHGARVEPVVGGLMIGFLGFPTAREDDAVRAVRAAVEVRDCVESINEPVAPHAARVVVETGDVVITSSGGSLADMVSGPAVSSAFRLGRRDGDVVVGPRTLQLVRGAAVVERLSVEEVGWRVIQVVDNPHQTGGGHEPIVGRTQELAMLHAAFQSAVRSAAPERFVIVGEAGIGKTRLVANFLDSLANQATVAVGRCPSYGEGITFLPLREALLDAAGEQGWPALAELVPDTFALLASGLGLAPGMHDIPAMFGAVATLLDALSASKPLVLVLDDLHWAEPTLLDLVDHIVRSGNGPLLVVCLGRPELLDQRAEWTDALSLAPLHADDVATLLRTKTPGIDDGDVREIVNRARGNPLFAEQLRAAQQDGELDELPLSLQALLASRLDRLGPGERDLLRVAAVVGDDCGRDAIASLLPAEATVFLERLLAALERKGLLTNRDDGGVHFAHVLIRLAAYRSVTHADRAALHQRYAEWLLSSTPQLPELDELSGYHLEQAVQSLRTIGVDHEALAARAVAHLSHAGERAVARADQSAAQNLLSRARAMMTASNPTRTTVTQKLAEVDLVLGKFGEAQQLLLELAERSSASGDMAAAQSARLEHARIQLVVGPDPVPLSEIEGEAAAAESFFSACGDDGGRGRSIFLKGCVRLRQGRLAEAQQAFRTSVELADGADSVRERLASRWMLADALATGPVPVHRCLSEVESLKVPGREHPGLMIHAGILYAMDRRFQEARELLDRAQRVVQDALNAPRLLMFVAAARGTIETLAGNRDAAEQALRTRLNYSRRTGERETLPVAAALLSLLLQQKGLKDEAAELASLAAATAPAEGVEAQALSAAASAMVAVSSDLDEATDLSQRALQWAPAEMPSLRGDIHRIAAKVCSARDDQVGREAAVAEAARCYRSKGNVAALAKLH